MYGRRYRLAVWAIFLFFGIGASARAEEFYYVLIFGSESQPKRLRHTHTWATFVRAVGTGRDPNNYHIYQHTISWLPRSLNVRVWNPIPEPGINLDLYRTLQYVYSNGENVILWGPFLISPELYERSLRIYWLANSGIPRYRAISTRTNMLVSDCIHAIAAVDQQFGRGHYPLIRIGQPASRFIAREVMIRSYENRGVYQGKFDNSWLIPRLALSNYPIQVVSPAQIPMSRCFLCRQPD
jgi:hypothetical protein